MEPPSGFLRYYHLARGDQEDGAHQPSTREVFGHNPMEPRLDRPSLHGGIPRLGEGDHSGVWGCLDDADADADRILVREGRIEEHDVGRFGGGNLDGFEQWWRSR
jgi:hypothetical protein